MGGLGKFVRDRGNSSEGRAQLRAQAAAGSMDAQPSVESKASMLVADLMGSDMGARLEAAKLIAQSHMEGKSLPEVALAQDILQEVAPDTYRNLIAGLSELTGTAEAEAAAPAADVTPPPVSRKGQTAAASKNYPAQEQWKTHGEGKDTAKDPATGKRQPGERVYGLGDLVKNMSEKRSRLERAEQGNSLMSQYTASPEGYRAVAAAQLDKLTGSPVTPELAAGLSPRAISAITGLPVDQITPEVREQLIGQPLSSDQASSLIATFREGRAGVTRAQRTGMVGLGHMSLDQMSADDLAAVERHMKRLGAFNPDPGSGDVNHMTMSAVDSVVARIRGDADRMSQGRPGSLNIDELPILRGLRYPFYQSQGGQLSQPPLAPSGEFAASLVAQAVDPKMTDAGFQAMAAPVLDAAIRRSAPVAPLDVGFRGKAGMTAADFAKLKLPPARGGSVLRANENNWRFPQFMEGVQMNRGQPKEPLNLGGLLLDPRSSAPAAETTITTPEGEMAPPPTEPPVMPSSGDTSMYDPRQLSLLAALLA